MHTTDIRTTITGSSWPQAILVAALLLMLHLPAASVMAQDDTVGKYLFEQADEKFRSGQIEQARELLTANISSLKGKYRVDALRLIALGYLARYDDQQAEHYIEMMLQENPYYSTTSQDPPRFVDIVNSIKTGMTATVTTASSQEESLAEVPVPTTLITEQMIKDSGARNLQEVLAYYVPGMNIIDCNEDINIAMRGIYSNKQEKMLFLLNGHRLNSYFSNAASPNYSMSLEKVRQIEVLRGPASSVYGGVALTAVVNIITKRGADVDGIDMKAAAGNYGQLRGDVVMGKRYFDLDVLAWASAYGSKGEKREVDEKYWGYNEAEEPIKDVTIGHAGERPSYDLGLQLNFRGLQLLYNTHFSQLVAPFTFATTSSTYDHDRYRTYNGASPSCVYNHHYIDIGYRHQTGPFSLSYSGTYDYHDVTYYHVLSETPQPYLGEMFTRNEELLEYFAIYPGLSRYINGQEQNYGLQLKATYNYQLPGQHKGSLVLGTEYSHLSLEGMRHQEGYGYEMEWPESPELRQACLGHENSANASLQLKHQWRSLILNAGLRYDYKHRFENTDANELSPRVALILLQPKWNVKLSYSKSFVDAPYLYRAENRIWFLMQDDPNLYLEPLGPERLYSWQLSFGGNNWIKGLDFEVNGFYNRASDLILTNFALYQNTGRNKTIGLEMMASYRLPRLKVDFNLTWTKTFLANMMLFDDNPLAIELLGGAQDYNCNNNTPAIMSNAMVTWQATPRLKLHTHVLFESKQTSYYSDINAWLKLMNLFDMREEAETQEEQEYLNRIFMEEFHTIVGHQDMPAHAIVDVGAEYQIGPVTLGLDVHNLFDTHYDRSGMNTKLVPQKSRWWTVSASFHF